MFLRGYECCVIFICFLSCFWWY